MFVCNDGPNAWSQLTSKASAYGPPATGVSALPFNLVFSWYATTGLLDTAWAKIVEAQTHHPAFFSLLIMVITISVCTSWFSRICHFARRMLKNLNVFALRVSSTVWAILAYHSSSGGMLDVCETIHGGWRGKLGGSTARCRCTPIMDTFVLRRPSSSRVHIETAFKSGVAGAYGFVD
jgi:hypothetical protein